MTRSRFRSGSMLSPLEDEGARSRSTDAYIIMRMRIPEPPCPLCAEIQISFVILSTCFCVTRSRGKVSGQNGTGGFTVQTTK